MIAAFAAVPTRGRESELKDAMRAWLDVPVDQRDLVAEAARLLSTGIARDIVLLKHERPDGGPYIVHREEG